MNPLAGMASVEAAAGFLAPVAELQRAAERITTPAAGLIDLSDRVGALAPVVAAGDALLVAAPWTPARATSQNERTAQ